MQQPTDPDAVDASEEVAAYLDGVTECTALLARGLGAYPDDEDAFTRAVNESRRRESACDAQLRRLHVAFGREDDAELLRLFLLLDVVPGQAETMLRTVDAARPSIPPRVLADLRRMAELSVAAVERLRVVTAVYVDDAVGTDSPGTEALGAETRPLDAEAESADPPLDEVDGGIDVPIEDSALRHEALDLGGEHEALDLDGEHEALDLGGEVQDVRALEGQCDELKYGALDRLTPLPEAADALLLGLVRDLDGVPNAAEDAADHLLYLASAGANPVESA